VQVGSPLWWPHHRDPLIILNMICCRVVRRFLICPTTLLRRPISIILFYTYGPRFGTSFFCHTTCHLKSVRKWNIYVIMVGLVGNCGVLQLLSLPPLLCCPSFLYNLSFFFFPLGKLVCVYLNRSYKLIFKANIYLQKHYYSYFYFQLTFICYICIELCALHF